MITTPDEILTRFASGLSCAFEVGYPTPTAPSNSTLPYLVSSSDDGSCSFPCLSLKRARVRKSHLEPLTSHRTKKTGSDDDARNFGRIVRMGRHNIAVAPVMLLRNLLGSFGYMIRLRLQRTLLRLMEKASSGELEGGNASSTDDVQMSPKQQRLSAAFTDLSSSDVSSIISPESASLNFHVRSGAPGQHPGLRFEDMGGTRTLLPLEFEAAIDVLILGTDKVTVYLRAPGTISGVCMHQKNRPDTVDIRVDTAALLASMKKQCRDVVKRAVSATADEEDNGTPKPPLRDESKKISQVSAFPKKETRQVVTERRNSC